jgi:cell division protein ZapA (FtsZ GTPase activity inhibitor)
VGAAQAEQGRSQQLAQVAQAQVDAALADLRSEFGVSSIEEARTLAGVLASEVGAEVRRITEALAAAGG